jgi:hypothetical protein
MVYGRMRWATLSTQTAQIPSSCSVWPYVEYLTEKQLAGMLSECNRLIMSELRLSEASLDLGALQKYSSCSMSWQQGWKTARE